MGLRQSGTSKKESFPLDHWSRAALDEEGRGPLVLRVSLSQVSPTWGLGVSHSQTKQGSFHSALPSFPLPSPPSSGTYWEENQAHSRVPLSTAPPAWAPPANLPAGNLPPPPSQSRGQEEGSVRPQGAECTEHHQESFSLVSCQQRKSRLFTDRGQCWYSWWPPVEQGGRFLVTPGSHALHNPTPFAAPPEHLFHAAF